MSIVWIDLASFVGFGSQSFFVLLLGATHTILYSSLFRGGDNAEFGIYNAAFELLDLNCFVAVHFFIDLTNNRRKKVQSIRHIAVWLMEVLLTLNRIHHRLFWFVEFYWFTIWCFTSINCLLGVAWIRKGVLDLLLFLKAIDELWEVVLRCLSWYERLLLPYWRLCIINVCTTPFN